MSYSEAETVTSQLSHTELARPPAGWQEGQFTVPYVSYAQDEFSSSVQRIFLLAAFHAEDVNLA